MINEFTNLKWLRGALIAACENADIELKAGDFDPKVLESYATDFVMYNDPNAIGLANDSGDSATGIYQININVKKTRSDANAKSIIFSDAIRNEFTRGRLFKDDTQTLEIKASKSTQVDDTDTHKVRVISITFNTYNR